MKDWVRLWMFEPNCVKNLITLRFPSWSLDFESLFTREMIWKWPLNSSGRLCDIVELISFLEFTMWYLFDIYNRTNSFLWQFYFNYNFVIYIKEEKRWRKKYIKVLRNQHIENDSKRIEIRIFNHYNVVVIFFFCIIH